MIKKLLTSLLLLTPGMLWAQTPDKDPYPGYNHNITVDWSLMRMVKGFEQYKLQGDKRPQRAYGDIPKGQTLPDHFNNADYKYFPPIFSQGGYGSCGVSSHVGYMMTSEMNAYNNTDASLPENQLTPMFEYPFTYNGPGKEDMAVSVGFPNAVIYGGRYESKIYGGSEWNKDAWGWCTGYDLFFDAMGRRVGSMGSFPLSVGTPEGAEAVKWYLYNHSGDPAYGGRGGICCIGVGAAASGQGTIGKTAVNSKIGVAGMRYLKHWNIGSVDHAATIVGYDDRIEFDLDENGVYGEENNSLGQNEKGAWIIANTWGDWANKGFIYCPYAMGGPMSQEVTVNGKKLYKLWGNSYWQPFVFVYRGGYKPKRTMKVTMSYIGRSEISVKVGVAQDLKATKPEQTFTFAYINFTGDGVADGVDAPTPMLGRWADGQMHYEPMEFGVDMTDLSSHFDIRKPLKYFLVIDSKKSAKGTGGIHQASVIDYEFNDKGNEIPIDIQGDSVQIQNQGKQTIISTIVPGEPLNAPYNLNLSGGKLTWSAPVNSPYKPVAYQVYDGKKLIATVKDTQYTPSADANASYMVKAVYQLQGQEFISYPSNTVAQKGGTDNLRDNNVLTLNAGGFIIPDVARQKYQQYTIEYWYRPSSLTNWNQSIGLNWGSFLSHADDQGGLTAGWATGQHRTTAGNAYTSGVWKHYALVFDHKTLKIYVNGELKSSVTSDNYSGFPTIGNLPFGAKHWGGNRMSGTIDEVRIWSTARNADELKNNYGLPIADPQNMPNLLAYLKMDTFEKDGKTYIKDWAHGHHAEIPDNNFSKGTDNNNTINNAQNTAQRNVRIEAPKEAIQGQLVEVKAITNVDAYHYQWTVTEGTPTNAVLPNPTFKFDKPGDHTITLKVTDYENKNERTAQVTIKILPEDAPTADFKLSAESIKGNDRISFIPLNKASGCTYHWDMPEAEVTKAETMLAGANYSKTGQKTVTLTVTDKNGKKYTKTKTFEVKPSMPKAAYNIEPNIVVKGTQVKLDDKSLYAPTKGFWLFSSNNNDFGYKELHGQITPDVPGVYDLYYEVENDLGKSVLQTKRALIVCNANSENGLTIDGDDKNVTVQRTAKSSQEFSIEFWMRPNDLSSNANSITATNGSGTLSIHSDNLGNLIISNNGKSVKADNMLIADQWNHYAITCDATGQTKLYRDGELIKSGDLGAADYGSLFKTIRMGKGSAQEYSAHASYDEFRVWDKCLTLDQIKTYAVSPINDNQLATAKGQGLILYFPFNQNSGPVTDKVTGQPIGIRNNFGPDGDAWINSKGVFALSFDGRTKDDMSKAGKYLNLQTYRIREISDEEVEAERKEADYAFDDSDATLWHSKWANGAKGYPHYVVLAKANDDIVKGLELYYPANRGDIYRVASVKIEQSNDLKNWDVLEYKRRLAKDNNYGIIFSTPQTQKYLKITFLECAGGGSFLAIGSIKLKGESRTLKSTACGLDFVSVSDQDTQGQGQGIHAVDGNESTAWKSAMSPKTNYPHNIVLKSKSDSGFDLLYFDFTTGLRSTRMDIYVSDDNNAWTLYEKDVRIPAYRTSTVALDKAITKRYIKLVFTKDVQLTDNGRLGINEIKAYLSEKESLGIDEINRDENTSVSKDRKIYDLQGHYMGTDSSVLPKGIYIRGNKKFIIK